MKSSILAVALLSTLTLAAQAAPNDDVLCDCSGRQCAAARLQALLRFGHGTLYLAGVFRYPATGRGSAPGMDAPRLCNWPWRRHPGANPTAASSAFRSAKRVDPGADDGCGLGGKPCDRRVVHSQEAIGCGVRGRMTQ